MIIWLTGQPGSGKTTIARKLQELSLDEQTESISATAIRATKSI